MQKTLWVTLKIEVDELDPEERAHQAELAGCRESDLPGVASVEQADFAHLVAETLIDLPEMFDGSMIPCQITNAVVWNCASEPLIAA